MAGNNLNWQQVRADFNDANSAMRNAQSGFSQAGTVFGQLRKSILDEEQRAVENAYKEKIFDENVRQFGLKHALDEERLAEATRQFGLTHGLSVEEARERARHNAAVEANQARTLALSEEQYRAAQEKEAALAKTYQDYFGGMIDANAKYQRDSAAHTKIVGDLLNKAGATDRHVYQLSAAKQDFTNKLAKGEQEAAQLEKRIQAVYKDATTDDSGYNPSDETDYQFLNVNDSDLLPVKASDTLHDLRKRLDEVNSRNTALRQTLGNVDNSLLQVKQARDDILAQNPAPEAPQIPIDNYSRLMQLIALNGNIPANSIPALMAFESIKSARDQAIKQGELDVKTREGQLNRQSAEKVAQIRSQGGGGGGDGKGAGADLGEYKPLVTDVTNLIIPELKSRGHTVSKSELTAFLKDYFFARTLNAKLNPWADYAISPKGILGSPALLEDVRTLLATGEGSSEARRALQEVIAHFVSRRNTNKNLFDTGD